MNIDAIPVGAEPPWDINVIVEVPKGGEPVKYELDKTSGALYVDRIMHTAMRYPCNYGFVPHTLSEDGDPIDVLIASDVPFLPGCVVRVRPVGVLFMTDEAGPDEKILSVPVDALHPYYTGVKSYEDLPQILREQISHFFLHYKDLEPNKWVKLDRWGDQADAARLIEQAIARHNG
ncbi:MAG: inorganic diphosphatase [Rhodospirillaceae bacterium]|nr:inorganic diphosphatase [Rhodospirillaceae bacterium]MDD9916258.1 inorganic diphosphatase [Rhodospirillaceae bacterium]MDD9926095.1 inorganic diphosphatase [Rhodospirillaceae bacterium]